jgi:hypothetical protein
MNEQQTYQDSNTHSSSICFPLKVSTFIIIIKRITLQQFQLRKELLYKYVKKTNKKTIYNMMEPPHTKQNPNFRISMQRLDSSLCDVNLLHYWKQL